MSVKRVEVQGIGVVKLYKRRDARSIKISLGHGNDIRVTMPIWVPYKAGLEYLKSKSNWIEANRRPAAHLLHGTRIGKAHQLVYFPRQVSTVSARVTQTEIRVSHPVNLSASHESVQTAAKKASQKALRQEAQILLPQRLMQLAEQHDFEFASVKVKNLRSRWGSCSPQKEIALNIYLMQLPWQLIDYVLLHELTHTKHLNHSADFWSELETCLPGAKQLRKDLRTYQPSI
jgi:predicted metal-dependent hydrolase